MIKIELWMQNLVTDAIAPVLVGTATAVGRQFNPLK
ncbi:hypothetical protein ABIE52_000104 [Rhodococcus sp. OAS809]|jgi:hypothetical protein